MPGTAGGTMRRRSAVLPGLGPQRLQPSINVDEVVEVRSPCKGIFWGLDPGSKKCWICCRGR